MFIGVHFPKSGGMSVAKALERHFGDALLLDYEDNPARPESQFQVDPESYAAKRETPPAGGRCVWGHFNPSKYAHLEATRFTILRHPVDNLISIYFFWQDHADGLLPRYFRAAKLDIIQLARLPIMRRLMSHTFFGGVDMTTFDFIGRHEAPRTETNAAICKLTGAAPFDDIHVNPSTAFPQRAEIAADPRIRSALTDLLRDDIAFYEKWARG